MLTTGEKILFSLTQLAAIAASLIAAPGPDGLLAAPMLAVTASDADRYVIPNQLTTTAAALALLRAAAIGPEAGWEAMG